MDSSDFRPDVVAGKYDAKKFDPTGETLLVNEVFYSLQGEGYYAGQAAVFVRLAKCNLACKFCDTEFETHTTMTLQQLTERVCSLVPPLPDGNFRSAPDGSADNALTKMLRPFVVLTGGEPMLQNCGPLIEVLHSQGFRVHIETSGSVWSDWANMLDSICVSPKVKKDSIPKQLRESCNEMKWIVNAAFIAQYERDPASVYEPGCINYLQPESLNPKWTAAAIKLIQAEPWRYRLSMQTHKLANIP
jgi:7-carboxy-7-deazaguanine synthase